MLTKKRLIITVFSAMSLTLAANSFAMMGGGGHGAVSNRYYSGQHYRYYDNTGSIYLRAGTGGQRYDGAYEVRGRIRYNGYADYHHNGGNYNYNDHMNGYNPHYYPQGGRIEFSVADRGYGYYHHN